MEQYHYELFKLRLTGVDDRREIRATLNELMQQWAETFRGDDTKEFPDHLQPLLWMDSDYSMLRVMWYCHCSCCDPIRPETVYSHLQEQ